MTPIQNLMIACSGLRCSRKSTCRRFSKNLWSQIEDIMGVELGVAQYADHEGKCSMYIQQDPIGQAPVDQL